jgi:undecaprenyl-diphosphatase
MSTITSMVKRSDIAIFFLFNRKLRCQFLSLLMKCLTELGSTAFSVILPAAFLIFGKKSVGNTGIRLSVVLILSQILVQSIKRIVDRPRPYKTLQQVIAIKPPSCVYSFPSGHTCAAFSMGFVLSFSFPALSLLFLGTALLVGISRMYLGFHYPTDVTVGIVIAYISFMISGVVL